MKNKVWYTIAFVTLLVFVIAGATYAFFLGSIKGTNIVNTDSKKFEILFTGDESLTGNLYMTSSKTDNYKRTVTVKTGQGSVQAKLNLYINIEEISENLAVQGFVWEVYGYQSDTQVFSNSGTFAGKSAAIGNNTIDLTDFTTHPYTITEDETTFDVYLWLDGSKVDDSVLGSTFKGTIGARSENFTGIPK